MLREKEIRRVYPNKTVLEDVLTREGPATEDSFSPYDGKAYLIDKQINTPKLKARFNLYDFLEAHYTREVSPIVLGRGVLSDSTAGPSVVTDKSKVCHTLEDTMEFGYEPPSLEKYVDNLLTGAKINNDSSVKYDEYLTRTIRNYDDDGDEEIEEGDLQIRKDDDDNITDKRYEDALRELPYLIKYIWDLSKKYGANLFTFIQVYQRKTKYNRYAAIETRDFTYVTTQQLKPDGTVKKLFDHKENIKYVGGPYLQVLDFFAKRFTHKIEFEYFDKFLSDVELLGVDFQKEDTLKIDNDWVNSIICTHLLTTDEYIHANATDDIEIFLALNPENILTSTKTSIYTMPLKDLIDDKQEVESANHMALYKDTLEYAYEAGTIPVDMFSDKRADWLDFLSTYMYYSGEEDLELTEDLFTVDDRYGFICDSSGDIYQFSTAPLGDYNEVHYIIVLATGYILFYHDEMDTVNYLSFEKAIKRLEEVSAGDVKGKRFKIDWDSEDTEAY